MNDVTVENYQGLAERTSATAGMAGCASAQVRIDSNVVRLLHGAMGLCTEAGELQDQLKRHIFYGKPLDVNNIAEECGDLFWYLAETLTAIDRRFIDVMQTNIDKLRTRYPEKFTEYAALNRDLGAERVVLEGITLESETVTFKQSSLTKRGDPRICPHCGVTLHTMEVCPDCATKGYRYAAGGTGGPVAAPTPSVWPEGTNEA